MIKAIKNYLYYRKMVKQLREPLFEKFGVRVDVLGRLYTVFTIPEKEYKEYVMQYFDHSEKLVDTDFRSYKKKLDNYLIKQGLTEMYGIYLEERVNERQFKLGIAYKHLDILFWANTGLVVTISMLIGAGIGLSLFLLLW